MFKIFNQYFIILIFLKIWNGKCPSSPYRPLMLVDCLTHKILEVSADNQLSEAKNAADNRLSAAKNAADNQLHIFPINQVYIQVFQLYLCLIICFFIFFYILLIHTFYLMF